MPRLDPQRQQAFAVDVVRRLREHGYTAYWAGGCVRDRLLGRRPEDYDVATTAEPDQIRDVFGRRRTLPIGAAFGVITVLGPAGAGQIDVATFRRDISYSDGRHPDQVAFTDPREDALRRDFTINGLFYDPLTDEVIDYVAGQEDLARGVVRAIGDPRTRLAEDKLRMLRAVRFAATFRFQLDEATFDAVLGMADQITVVSPERIAGEMRRMLTHERRADAVRLLRRSGLLMIVLPELSAIAAPGEAALPDVAFSEAGPPVITPPTAEVPSAWSRMQRVLEALRDPSFPLALAALLYPLGDAGQVRAIGHRWRLSSADTQRVAWLVGHATSLDDAPRMPWPRLARLLIEPGIDELMALHAARAAAGECDEASVVFCRERLQLPGDVLNPQPLITGDDLIRHGVPRGAVYRELLDQVRDAQLDGTVRTSPEALELVDRILADRQRRPS